MFDPLRSVGCLWYAGQGGIYSPHDLEFVELQLGRVEGAMGRRACFSQILKRSMIGRVGQCTMEGPCMGVGGPEGGEGPGNNSPNPRADRGSKAASMWEVRAVCGVAQTKKHPSSV